jgi:hypothetical protein
MYKVEIPKDSLQEAAINRRRKLDEERRKRIFDPKTRVLGVSKSFLFSLDLCEKPLRLL